MKKFTKRVGVFVMIICLSFCFGGCTIFPSGNNNWPGGQKPEYQRPAGDLVESDPTPPPTPEDETDPTYWDKEYYDGYSDMYSGLVTAYMPSVREEGSKINAYEQARVKFNAKVIEQYGAMSEYVLNTLLGKYGGGAVTSDITFDVGKSGVNVVTASVSSSPVENTNALFTTKGSIERSIDGVELSVNNPTTLIEWENAEIVAKLNQDNAWLCKLDVSEIGGDYNDDYILKYKGFLQIRLMEAISNSVTTTTLSTYNGYTAEQKSKRMADLSLKIPNLGVNNDSVLNSKIVSIINNEIIGDVALTRSNASVEVKEKFTWTTPSEIKYSLGEVVYVDEVYQVMQATTQTGEIYLEAGNPVEIVQTTDIAEKLFYPSGNPVLVDIDVDGIILKAHASVGEDYTVTMPDTEIVTYEKTLDINEDSVIAEEVYEDTSIYTYDYATDVTQVVNDMLNWANTMPKVDSREYISIDSSKYYSAITKPQSGQIADITNMEYQDYTSVIAYNRQYAFPWIMGIGIQSKEDLVVDVYIRVRKTFMDGQQQKTVTQILKLGTMHTDSTKDFYWEGDIEGQDEDSIDYDNLKANNRIWDICMEFGKLLPEVTMADMLPDSEAYIDIDGVFQYTINDIDFSKDKFRDYRYIYYMQTQGLIPAVVNGSVPSEVVPGADTELKQQGYYQGEYDRFVNTNKLSGTASDNREVEFSQNLVVFNDEYNSDDYIEIIFDVTNKDEVTDSTFKFYLEQYPMTQEEEE